jgi:hypothetical protein
MMPLEFLHHAFPQTNSYSHNLFFFFQGASERIIPHSLHPDVQQQVDSIFVKRLATLSESGVLPGADDWDILNPMVVRAASEVRAHVSSGTKEEPALWFLSSCFGSFFGAEIMIVCIGWWSRPSFLSVPYLCMPGSKNLMTCRQGVPAGKRSRAQFWQCAGS